MVRMSKKGEIRSVSPRRPRMPAQKTGPKKDNLATGYREHTNAVEGEQAAKFFIPKVK